MNVLITGGTGSLGRELTRQLLPTVDRLVIFARNELNLAKMQEDFGSHPNIRIFGGDVRDPYRLYDAMYEIDAVIHAAALKRVDQVASHPIEAILTNVTGTQNVLCSALAAGVKKVLLISSDKAVHAENFYGGTKFLAEQLTIRYNAISYPQGMICSVLRYGNVWGSNGSVVHVFRKQAAEGKPLTVTDPDMTRFFLTLKQAGFLVRRAVEYMRGGEIFVPALDAWSVKQVAMLFAPGWAPIGRRPGGEKDHERLLSDSEKDRAVYVDPFYMVPPELHEWTETYWAGGKAGYQGYHFLGPYSSDTASRVSRETLEQALKEIA